MVAAAQQSRLTDGVRGLLGRLHRAMGLINNRWPKEWSPDSLVAAVQTGNRATIDPSTARDEYRALRRGMPALLESIPKLAIDAPLARRIVRHLSSLAGTAPRDTRR